MPDSKIFEPYLVGRTDGKDQLTHQPNTGSKIRWHRVSLGFRAGLDYNGKVHRSRILVEWSNTIGNKISFSQVRGLQYGQDFSGGEIQAWMKNWHGCQHGSIFFPLGGGGIIFLSSSFLGNFKPSNKKLGLRIPTTWGVFVYIFYLACPLYHRCLKSCFWGKLLDRPVQFFTPWYKPILTADVGPMYRAWHSIWSWLVPCCSFHVGFKNTPTDLGLTHGKNLRKSYVLFGT